MVVNGKAIVEVGASPLTANAHPHHEENNGTRLHENTTGTQHFGVLQLKLSGTKGAAYHVGLYDAKGTALFTNRETLIN